MFTGPGKKIGVSLQMSRVSGHNIDAFRLTVEDTASHDRILEINIPPEVFADLMSTRATSGCEAQLYDIANVGKKLEVKDVAFDLPSTEEKVIRLTCRAWNKDNAKDGWMIEESEMKPNHHRFKNGKYTVPARRYVDA